jgi:hypothetical protein
LIVAHLALRPTRLWEFLQDAAVFVDSHVAVAAYQHQGSIRAEVAVPVDKLLIAPMPRILTQPLVADAVEIGSQADGGLIRRIRVGRVFE